MIDEERVISLAMRSTDDQETELAALLEALLLVAAGPVAVTDLAEASGVTVEEIERAVDAMVDQQDRGWVVQRHRTMVQLATAPRFASHIRRFLGLEREARLSAAALETVAIVAYRQPVTRATIEAIRGVDSTGVIATLISRGLIETAGRADTPGQPYHYVTTPAFLQHFGLTSLDDLPPLGTQNGVDLGEVLRQQSIQADSAAVDVRMVDSMLLAGVDSGQFPDA